MALRFIAELAERSPIIIQNGSSNPSSRLGKIYMLRRSVPPDVENHFIRTVQRDK